MASVLTEKNQWLEIGLQRALQANSAWEASFPDFASDPSLHIPSEKLDRALNELTLRLNGNYPFFHPLYAGQMLKPPHPVAVIGYLAAMLVNPNNHALDGGPPTAKMEEECIEALASSLGFETHLGHLTSSGTIANLEALWVARELHPDKGVAFSDQAHYTHSRMCDLIKVEGVSVPSLADGRMDVSALKNLLAEKSIGTVVVTLGTTSLGALDPLDEILALQQEFPFRIHIDAAYGGYYHVLRDTDEAFRLFRLVPKCDSFVVDPHKQGLQPYGCGAVIFRDPEVAGLYLHDSPYTYFSSPDRHLGEISLECSRAGAAAAALWLTLQCFPLKADEGMGEILKKNRQAATTLAEALRASETFSLYLDPQMDIVTYFAKAGDTEAISALSDRIFDATMTAEEPLFLAKLKVSARKFAVLHPEITINSEQVTILRSCLLKPEHAAWTPRIMDILEAAVNL